MAANNVTSDVDLSPALEADSPPEARGLRRDDVRLLVSDPVNDTVVHTRFRDLPRFLVPGDLLVVNASGTLSAAVPAVHEGGRAFEIHLSTSLPGGFWVVEVRQPATPASLPSNDASTGMRFAVPAGGSITVLAPYPFAGDIRARSRLWIAALDFPLPVERYLDAYGFPIRYGYVATSWPVSMYQTVFATEVGSAEMPSAGRPFTAELVARLVSEGVQIAPVLLHAGVSSPEKHEPPYEERYRVPRETAARITEVRRAGGRVIAVGTTVVRALETVTDDRGTTSPGEGWTSVVVTPDRPVRSVTGLITGLHEPRATHLALLESVVNAATAGQHGVRSGQTSSQSHLARAYSEARNRRYLWHEFGDSHLIVPGVHR